MADNYLERKMEDMKTGRLRPVFRRHLKKSDLAGKSFYVADGTSSAGKALVEDLRRRGATVAVSGDDREIGMRTASVYGASYVEVSSSCAESMGLRYESMGYEVISLDVAPDTDNK